MFARLLAFIAWALVAGTLMFWGLRLMVTAPAAPSYAVAVGDVAVAHGDLTALLGSAPVVAPVVAAAPAAASRFKLFGIVAPKYPGDVSARGVALIAVDGKMPKAYSIGSRLDGELTLKAVSLRTVSIGNAAGGGAITLELPLPTPAATGMLQSGSAENYVTPAAHGLPPGMSPTGPQMVPQMVPAAPPPAIVPQQMPSARPGGDAPVS